MLQTREAMLKQILAMRLNGSSESEDVFERNVMKCTISWKFFCSIGTLSVSRVQGEKLVFILIFL